LVGDEFLYPEEYSPVHITGPIDCLDTRTHLPVIIVEDITVDIGDRRIAELANEARVENSHAFVEAYVTTDFPYRKSN